MSKSRIKKVEEWLNLNEQGKTITKPRKPGTADPATTPKRPSPIRRGKPSVSPKPKATARDVVDRWVSELRSHGGSIDFNIDKLKKNWNITESRNIKTVWQFLSEASFEGNPATGDDYLRDVESRARQANQDTARRLGPRINSFMQIAGEVQSMQAGKERELEKLAEDSIRELYGSILDGVNLDIKFAGRQELKGEMEDVEMETPPEMEEIEDPNIIKEIHKRKISNAITQGEAKNTKLVLNP